jgi:hypothetical protein
MTKTSRMLPAAKVLPIPLRLLGPTRSKNSASLLSRHERRSKLSRKRSSHSAAVTARFLTYEKTRSADCGTGFNCKRLAGLPYARCLCFTDSRKEVSMDQEQYLADTAENLKSQYSPAAAEYFLQEARLALARGETNLSAVYEQAITHSPREKLTRAATLAAVNQHCNSL